MPNIKSLPLHLRPREKLVEKGVASLTDKELLAILLRTGRSGKSALDLAHDILTKFPLNQFSNLTLTNLSSLKGIDIGKSATILAAAELITRSLNKSPHKLPIIDSPRAALDQFADIRNHKKEHFVALYLNARNELIHKEIISIGTLTRSLVHPREVFAPALTHSAASVLVAHNHPSGDVVPSDDDLIITKRLCESAELLGIAIFDHLIITHDSSFSLREHGLLGETP